MRATALARISSLTGRDSHPEARSSPSVRGTSGGVVARRCHGTGRTSRGRSRADRRRADAARDLAVGRAVSDAASGSSWTGARVGRRRPPPRRHRPRRSTTATGPRSPCPGHWRSHPEFAASDGPLLYRRRFEHAAAAPRPAPLGHVRRHLLPGRRVARRRLPRRPGGLLLPPQLRRHRRCRGSATSTCSPSR